MTEEKEIDVDKTIYINLDDESIKMMDNGKDVVGIVEVPLKIAVRVKLKKELVEVVATGEEQCG